MDQIIPVLPKTRFLSPPRIHLHATVDLGLIQRHSDKHGVTPAFVAAPYFS